MNTANPYAILGLPPGADVDTARTAFRRVAMACHPDRAPGDHAARARFEEARAAYARILAARRAMDRMEAIRGAVKAAPHAPAPRAELRPRHPVTTAIVELELTPREAVHGAIKRVKGPDGAVLVRVPKGVREGDRLRGGDLLVLTIRLKGQAGYRADSHDIHGEVTIAAALAAEGGRTDVDTPHGRLRVAIPAGIPDGARLRLAGRGLPGRGNHPTGDLFLTVRIEQRAPSLFGRLFGGMFTGRDTRVPA